MTAFVIVMVVFLTLISISMFVPDGKPIRQNEAIMAMICASFAVWGITLLFS